MLPALLALSLVAPLAHAQTAADTALTGPGRVGLWTTGSSADADQAPRTLYLGFYGEPWPAAFQLVPGTPVPTPPAAEYPAKSFPGRARKAVPAPAPGELLYEITRCPAGVPCNAVVGYLRVSGGGATLHWYLHPAFEGDRLSVERGQELGFWPSPGAPDRTRYRYLKRKRR